ncbi:MULTISPECIES: DUF2242 domain-containing protein [Pseudoxanthomonas]|uniref:DUF2242 domain-containing protein n=1 Tax=Pseudoxanthomonas winnipegensis TaxID=2480810 RepID=A0AAW8G5U2_9GAMM|nr:MULTISPECIES: DUF2242 domain-containing protein [Pseudoxanthomonas]MDQ1117714.1 hypothetical protein [Pseudoxanthomonas winnipegensis]MDQ1134682.1 hypothetical protein [Pseudoxanthomonas winnipegensis]MDR6139084.1 hypothetical protein [Pseudoxanthomonas sp. SORGH_AS_0997]
MPNRLFSLVPLTAVLLLAGCGHMPFEKKGEMLAKENFDSDGTYSRTFDRSPEQVCEASRRALLSQGYVVSRSDASTVEANKNFQPEPEVHEQVAIRVSCVAQASGESWVFASATQDRYNLRKSNTSASVGTALGSLSLPFGSTDDSLVRVASLTVQQPTFYRSFFALVERYLPPPPPKKPKTDAAAKPAETPPPAPQPLQPQPVGESIPVPASEAKPADGTLVPQSTAPATTPSQATDTL